MPKKPKRFIPYGDYLESDEWQLKRGIALKKADFRCVICNSPKSLRVHHRTYDSFLTTDEIDDLFPLCKRCHEIYHAFINPKIRNNDDLTKVLNYTGEGELELESEKRHPIDILWVHGEPEMDNLREQILTTDGPWGDTDPLDELRDRILHTDYFEEDLDLEHEIIKFSLSRRSKNHSSIGINSWILSELDGYPYALEWLHEKETAISFPLDPHKLRDSEVQQRLMNVMYKFHFKSLDDLIEYAKDIDHQIRITQHELQSAESDTPGSYLQ